MVVKKLLEPEDDIDFSIIGISSHIKDYRLSWEINRRMKIDLEKGEDLFAVDRENDYGFSTSMYFDEESHIECVLINNKNEGGVLVSDHPKLDFLLRVTGPQHEFEMEGFKRELMNIRSILTVVSLNPENLKSKMNLVF